MWTNATTVAFASRGVHVDQRNHSSMCFEGCTALQQLPYHSTRAPLESSSAMHNPTAASCALAAARRSCKPIDALAWLTARTLPQRQNQQSPSPLKLCLWDTNRLG
jgi:hypothetical protein